MLGNSAALKQLRNIYLVSVHTGGRRINLYSSITVDFNKLAKLEHTVFSYMYICFDLFLPKCKSTLALHVGHCTFGQTKLIVCFQKYTRGGLKPAFGYCLATLNGLGWAESH